MLVDVSWAVLGTTDMNAYHWSKVEIRKDLFQNNLKSWTKHV